MPGCHNPGTDLLHLRIDKRIYSAHNRNMNTKPANGTNVKAWNPGCESVNGTVVDRDQYTVHVAWSLNGKNYVGRFMNWELA